LFEKVPDKTGKFIELQTSL